LVAPPGLHALPPLSPASAREGPFSLPVSWPRQGLEPCLWRRRAHLRQQVARPTQKETTNFIRRHLWPTTAKGASNKKHRDGRQRTHTITVLAGLGPFLPALLPACHCTSHGSVRTFGWHGHMAISLPWGTFRKFAPSMKRWNNLSGDGHLSSPSASASCSERLLCSFL
jgi:hypothetical protein